MLLNRTSSGPAIALTFSLACYHCARPQNPRDSSGSKSWAGSNLYFLHGLPLSDQTNYVETLAAWGVKVLRLWVTQTSAGCVKGSTDVQAVPPLEAIGFIGTYNTSVLASLDNTLKILSDNGIKAIISPHDAGSINGSNGCDAYCAKYHNSDTFYSSTDAKTNYDNRLKQILTYQSPNFGRPWASLSDVILAFDIQNEPMIGSTDMLENNDPNDWICGRAGVMKNILGNSNIKVATGGIGGSEYCCNHEWNMLNKALYCDAIDIMSVHGYMSKATDWAYFINGSASVLNQANSAGKHVMVEEWGVSTSYQDDFNVQVSVFNDNGMPWLYWQVIPGLDQTQSGAPSSCGYDGFEIGLASSKGDIADAAAAANAATANQSWIGYVP
ncbi:glycoside hydrolase family 5 protein [Glonium stellatum]|uniref:mannan endo-1,4-beta-mannosidase n=1 Tax=Glonium stellatum TaxID=574774 RepID=A0A8E2F3N6_9PEZI|nr:glycoside hydrolase family 5 protein [Glonium stellatum]